MINRGYLTANTTVSGDEVFTPRNVVLQLIKNLSIPKTKKIWCGFDNNKSEFVKVLKEEGYQVKNSHIENGQDFFNYEPDEWDIFISNPPFSKKDQVLKRLYELNKPYLLLLPLAVLQGNKRFEYIKKCGVITFDKRIQYTAGGSTPFASIWIGTLIKGLSYWRLENENKARNQKLVIRKLCE